LFSRRGAPFSKLNPGNRIHILMVFLEQPRGLMAGIDFSLCAECVKKLIEKR
jgi:hypothetical protein